MGWTCLTCDRDFVSYRARQQHMNALGHNTHECDSCTREFRTRAAAAQHMNACNHWEHERPICEKTWPSQQEVDDHVKEDHHHCTACDRTFLSYNNLKMHLNSRIHRSADMKCPFCKQGFVNATGLSHHLETGSCSVAPYLNREEVYKLVRSKDPSGIVAKKLIGWTSTPMMRFGASDLAWNGDGWECYFCNREFSTNRALNQHLSSPIHEQALYHCPNRSGCGREFKSLASVMNHLESESCGFTIYDRVQKGFRSIVGGDRLIGFH